MRMHTPRTTNEILIPPFGAPPPLIFSPPTNQGIFFFLFSSSSSTAKHPLPAQRSHQAVTLPLSPAGLRLAPQLAWCKGLPVRPPPQPYQTHLPLACYYKKDTAAQTYHSIP